MFFCQHLIFSDKKFQTQKETENIQQNGSLWILNQFVNSVEAKIVTVVTRDCDNGEEARTHANCKQLEHSKCGKILINIVIVCKCGNVVIIIVIVTISNISVVILSSQPSAPASPVASFDIIPLLKGKGSICEKSKDGDLESSGDREEESLI